MGVSQRVLMMYGRGCVHNGGSDESVIDEFLSDESVTDELREDGACRGAET